MFLRANGLFGWMDNNNKRSLALFAAFLIAFHLLGFAALAAPLMLSRPDYAPFLNWRGYALVVMPVLTAAGAAVFGVQYFWQTRIVRRRLKFRYVDAGDEPRLCRIAEPIVIAAGIQPPFLALIEDGAMNAFACGVRRSDTVIVVTRGLLDGLGDDELGAVLAHEIAHIRDGDIRLMAAANACASSIEFLFMNWKTQKPWRVAVALLGTVAFPWMFAIILALGLIRQISYWLAQAVRLGIASSREFIADAFAVRLTHNPAALVSALCKIEGHSRLHAAGSFEAMMIDGPTDGEQATHPRIAERIAALVSTTGAMALEGLTSREAPSPHRPSTTGFGRKRSPASAPRATIQANVAFEAPANRTIFALATRIARNSRYNLFGIQKKLNAVLVVWVVLFGVVNQDALADPVRLAARFNPATMPDWARHADEQACLQEFRSSAVNGGGGAQTQMTYGPECAGLARAAEARQRAMKAKDDAWVGRTIAANACFVSIPVDAPGAPEKGYWPLDKTESTVSAQSYFLLTTQLEPAVSHGAATDADLKHYVDNRRTGLMLLDDFYGPPGVEHAQQALLQPEHQAVLKRLGERLSDPGFAATLDATDRAEYHLLVDHPADFVPCKAKLGHNLLPPSNLASPDHVADDM